MNWGPIPTKKSKLGISFRGPSPDFMGKLRKGAILSSYLFEDLMRGSLAFIIYS